MLYEIIFVSTSFASIGVIYWEMLYLNNKFQELIEIQKLNVSIAQELHRITKDAAKTASEMHAVVKWIEARILAAEKLKKEEEIAKKAKKRKR